MSKKIKIFAGPKNDYVRQFYFEETDEILVGIDSGCESLIDHELQFQLAIGDFDSIDTSYKERLEDYAKEIISLPKVKDETDLAYALEYIYNHFTYDAIEIYGGIGGRIDHLLANLNLLKKYDASLKDAYHHIFVLHKGKYHLDNFYKHISFFAIEDVYQLNLTGFKYELNQYFLSTSDSVCVSNEGSGSVEFSKGRLLVVCSNKS